MLHKTSYERYEKLKKEFRRLMVLFDGDDLDNFIQTANSLREWIKKDIALVSEQRSHLEEFIVPQSIDWQICNQIANTQKHAKSATRGTKKKRELMQYPTVSIVRFKVGGAGFFEPESGRVFGAGERIEIEYAGRSEEALAFVIRCFKHFHYIFELAPISVNERRVPTLAELAGFNSR